MAVKEKASSAACSSRSSRSAAVAAASTASSSSSSAFLLAFEGREHSKAVRCVCCISSPLPQQQQQQEMVEELVSGGLDSMIVVWSPVAASEGSGSSNNSRDDKREDAAAAAAVKYVPRLLLRPHTDYVYCLTPYRCPVSSSSNSSSSNSSSSNSSSSNSSSSSTSSSSTSSSSTSSSSSSSSDGSRRSNDGGERTEADVQEPSFFSGSKDKRALRISAVDGRVLQEYRGHEGAVCSMSQLQQQNLLVTGSWDDTARVWGVEDGACRHVLQPHKYAVTVFASDSMQLIVTGAQDKILRFWSPEGALLHSLSGAHDDIIRALDCLPPLGSSSGSTSSRSSSRGCEACGALLSASNDTTVKVWDWSSRQKLLQLHGHTAFIFDVKASRCRAGRIFSAADDRTCRVWEIEEAAAADAKSEQQQQQPQLQQKSSAQVLLHAATVWGVAELRSGDLATCCEDGVLRIWTEDETRALPEGEREKQQAAAEAATAEAAAAHPEEALDVDSLLPVSQVSTLRGRKDGEVKLFRDGDAAVVYQWQQSSSTWVKVGEAVGRAPQSTYFYEGDEYFAAGNYDIIFTVDIGGGDAFRKLPFRDGDDPEEAAGRFCAREKLHGRACVEHVAAFIRRNFRSAAAVAASRKQETPQNHVSSSSSSKHFPLLQPLRFSQAKNIKAAAQRIFAFNDSLSTDDTAKLSEQERVYLEAAFEKLFNASHSHEEFRSCELEVFFDKLSSWPSAAAMPVIDCWRLLVLHSSNPLSRYKRPGGDHVWHLVVVTLRHIRAASAAKEEKEEQQQKRLQGSLTTQSADHVAAATSDAAAAAAEDPALLVCCLRFLANLLDSPHNRAALLRHSTPVLDAVAAALQASCSSSSKHVRAAAAVLCANYAIALSTSTQGEDVSSSTRVQVLQLLRDLLAAEVDADIFYRGLTAVGTLLLTPQQQLRAAAQQQSRQLNFAAVLPPLNMQAPSEGKVGEAAQDLLLLLE